MAVGCELGPGALEEANVYQRQDLGGCGSGRLASTSPSQDPTLDAGVTGEHGQNEMAVTEGVMVEYQRFVFDNRHALMVANSMPIT